MSFKPSQFAPYRTVLCSLTLGLVLSACGTGNSSSSESSSSSTSVSSSSSSSSVSSSSSSVPRPSGPPVDPSPANASWQSPAFQGQTDAPGATSPFTVKTQNITTSLNKPWGIEFLPDGRMLITEREGAMKIVTTSGQISNVSGVPQVFSLGQAGLMDVAISPNFESDRMVYFTYVETRDGGQATSAAKAKLSEDYSRLEEMKVIFRQGPSWANVAPSGLPFIIHGHFGSRLAWDFNGNLFMTVGERYNDEIRVNAQSLDNTLGKVIHITPDGEATLDNPFVNQGNAKAEIWSYGHRNVQAVDVHPLTGEVWIVEMGPQGGDELNKPEAGKNYGWPVITYGRNYDFLGGTNNPIGDNTTAKDGMEQPRYYWDPVIAPSSGLFYDGDMFPEWENNMLVGGLVTKDITRLILDGDDVIGEERLVKNSGRVRDFTIAEDGSLYVVNDEGRLFRVYR